MTSLATLQREIDQLFGRLAPEGRPEQPVPAGEWSPNMDVFECREQIVVMVEVPGLAPDSLRVIYKNHRLVITGERRERRTAPAGAVFLCLERAQGRFNRTVPLDQAVDIPHVEARLANGVLTVLIPRLKDRRGRETVIPIQCEEPPNP